MVFMERRESGREDAGRRGGVSVRVVKGGFDVPVCCGAAVLPYTVSHDGRVFFVLGKERMVRNWKGSLKWAAFGGGKKGSEVEEETAAREFVEESLGVLPFGEEEGGKLCQKEEVEKVLKEKGYCARIVMRLKRDRSAPKFHVTFLKKVPWMPHVVQKFAMVRKVLMEVNEVANRLEFMKASLPFRYPFLREKMVVEYMGRHQVVTSVNCVEVEGTSLSLSFEYHPLSREGEEADPTSATVTCEEDTKLLTTYVEWFRYREVATRFVKQVEGDAMNHSAIRADYNAKGILVSLSVMDDCLEKQELRLWSAQEMESLLLDQTTGGDFKAYFVPLIQIALQLTKT